MCPSYYFGFAITFQAPTLLSHQIVIPIKLYDKGDFSVFLPTTEGDKLSCLTRGCHVLPQCMSGRNHIFDVPVT